MKTELVMYILINEELKMGKGKIAAQVGHVVQKVTEACLNHIGERWVKYTSSFHAKIVLRSNTKHLVQIIEKYSDKTSKLWCEYVIDAGRTQVYPGSLTALAFCPIQRQDTPSFIKDLKLC